MLMSMMSSPRRRAAIFSSPVMLNTYGGRRLMRGKSFMGSGGSKMAPQGALGKMYNPLYRMVPQFTVKLHLANADGLNLHRLRR